MNIESITKLIIEWKKEEYFSLYYRSGEYHRRALQYLKLENLLDFKTLINDLKPIYPLSNEEKENLKSLEENKYELIRNHRSELKYYLNEFNRKNIINTYEIDLKNIEEKLIPLETIEENYKISKANYELLSEFFLYGISFKNDDTSLECSNNYKSIIESVRFFNDKKSNFITNWKSLLSKALCYENFVIIDSNYDDFKIRNRHEINYKKHMVEKYQLLSGYLIGIRNSLNQNNYRVDELSRFNLSMNNGILAILEIKKLPNDNHFNEAIIGEIKNSSSLSNSGYNYTLHLLSSLILNFEGYQFNFEFDAYSVLMNTNGFNVDASSKLLDDKDDENNY
ncbi:hypothetical protein [Leeuwenhoekiella sp. NPDC079379]|uniref:hypothetical protein n=1 Tax=Leeuwenhoekiella sp. NPDC079379 TaxID=3364122 RepID=UPI0037C99703